MLSRKLPKRLEREKRNINRSGTFGINVFIRNRKIDRRLMSVEAITEALHEYMYENLNDSPETDDEQKNRFSIKERQEVQTNQRTIG